MRLRGFTLVEMLVVMAISAILIAAAVPSFQAITASSRASSASGMLISSLEFARSEAIRRNQAVTVCRTTNANAAENVLSCSETAGAGFDGNDWGSGWIVFAKAGAGANVSVFEWDADPTLSDFLLLRQQPINTGLTRAAIWSTLPGPQRVAYRGDGMPAAVIGTRFFIDYFAVPTPAVDDRDPDALAAPLTFAGRCLAVAGGSGRVRAYRPTAAGTCPTL